VPRAPVVQMSKPMFCKSQKCVVSYNTTMFHIKGQEDGNDDMYIKYILNSPKVTACPLSLSLSLSLSLLAPHPPFPNPTQVGNRVFLKTVIDTTLRDNVCQ
jgi:hypothetical protein